MRLLRHVNPNVDQCANVLMPLDCSVRIAFNAVCFQNCHVKE